MTGASTRDRLRVEPTPHLPIDPRIAARWVSVQRDQDRRRRRVVVGFLVGVSALVGAWILARSPVLSAQRVVVRGTGHTERGAILSAAGPVVHHPLLDLDVSAMQRRIRALPWVAGVRVRRDWPTTVTIDITERQPVAQVATTAGQPAIVDRTGRVLAVAGQASGVLSGVTPALPQLLGMAVVGPPGSTLGPSAGGVLAILQSLGARVSVPGQRGDTWQVTAVDRAADGTLGASLLPGPVSVIFGSTVQLDAKMVALHSLLTQVVPGQVATIDVEVADAPVLTEGMKSSSLSTAQRG